MNIFKGMGFRLVKDDKPISPRSIVLDFDKNKVLYYYTKDGTEIVENVPTKEFKKHAVYDNNAFVKNILYAKLIGYKESAKHFGMGGRKRAFLYSLMQIISSEPYGPGAAFTLMSVADNDIMVKMVAQEIDIIFPINSYKL